MKGGIGKSTLAVNLAWHFAGYPQWNKKVLLVDLDPQFNASQYLLGVREYGSILSASKALELAGVVFNAASDYLPEEALAKTTVKDIARKNGWYVLQREVEYSRSYPKGAREGRPIFCTSYCRSGKVRNFELFAKEFAQRVGL